MSDLLTGLLNVVGEGLKSATNYVKEQEAIKKKEKVRVSKQVEICLVMLRSCLRVMNLDFKPLWVML